MAQQKKLSSDVNIKGFNERDGSVAYVLRIKGLDGVRIPKQVNVDP